MSHPIRLFAKITVRIAKIFSNSRTGKFSANTLNKYLAWLVMDKKVKEKVRMHL